MPAGQTFLTASSVRSIQCSILFGVLTSSWEWVITTKNLILWNGRCTRWVLAVMRRSNAHLCKNTAKYDWNASCVYYKLIACHFGIVYLLLNRHNWRWLTIKFCRIRPRCHHRRPSAVATSGKILMRECLCSSDSTDLFSSSYKRNCLFVPHPQKMCPVHFCSGYCFSWMR